MNSKYEMIIYWSEEDGHSYAQAVGEAEKVIALWIETAREEGRPIPKPRGRLMFA